MKIYVAMWHDATITIHTVPSGSCGRYLYDSVDEYGDPDKAYVIEVVPIANDCHEWKLHRVAFTDDGSAVRV
jgi:hypothetical protein